MNIQRTVWIVLAVVLFSLVLSHLPACVMDAPAPVFVFRTSPLLEQQQFADGNLGVIRPSYERRFLLVAYRYLNEAPLTPREKRAFLGEPAPRPVPSALELWKRARLKVPNVAAAPKIFPWRTIPGTEWQKFLNCPDDAFVTARRTLQERIGIFGLKSQEVRNWTRAQDVVFSNCGGWKTIPSTPPPQLPAILKADRAYQRAAAHFYATDYEEARKQFAAIASDASSPWRVIAPYLEARCLIRRATVTPEFGQVHPDFLAEAAEILRRLLDDDSRKAIHGPARRLRDYVLARINPRAQLVRSANAASDSSRQEEFGERMADFVFLMKKLYSDEIRAAAKTSDLVDWTLCFEGRGPGETDAAIKRWQQTRSPAWLMVALAKTGWDDPRAVKLRAAAARIGPDSPAYATLLYHRNRLLIDSGRRDQARELLDKVLPGLEKRLPASALNALHAERMAAAGNLDEFLRFAPRRVLGIGLLSRQEALIRAPEPSDPKQELDADSLWIFNNSLPLHLLIRASRSRYLSDDNRRRLLLMSFARALLLDDGKAAANLGGRVLEMEPSLAPLVKSYQSAGGNEQRRFAMACLLLKNPGLQPNFNRGFIKHRRLETLSEFRNNWWRPFTFNPCAGAAGQQHPVKSPDPNQRCAEWLTAAEREDLVREWKRLQSLGAAPDYLGSIAISYAKKHPGDPRVPEALHWVVKASRLGVTSEKTSGYSRQAFQFLHRRYPKSEWTRKTPHWFQ